MPLALTASQPKKMRAAETTFNNLQIVRVDDEAIATAEHSGTVLMLNSSATQIVELFQRGFSRSEVEQAVVEHYGADADQVRTDIADLEVSIGSALDVPRTKKKKRFPFSPVSPLEVRYRFFDRTVQVQYPNHEFSSFLHPYFSVFQCASENADLNLKIERNTENSKIVCGDVAVACSSEVGADVLGTMCQVLTLYDQPKFEKYRSYMHSSVCLGPQGAWLIAGKSGSGKTTLAAALDAAGCTVLAEDIIPIDPVARVVLPMPTAMTIKPKGWKHFVSSFPEHAQAKEWDRGGGTLVRKVVPHNPPGAVDRKAHKIAGFLFPERRDSEFVGIEPITSKEAIRLLCDKYGRFPDTYSDLSALVSCVNELPKLSLRYSDVRSLVPHLLERL